MGQVSLAEVGTIALLANQYYYIEALHKEATGADNLSVGVDLPGGISELPIPGDRLQPFGLLTIQGAGNDTIRLGGDAANASMLDVFINNTSGVPDYQMYLPALQQVQVLGGEGNDTLIVDCSRASAFPSGGAFFDGGPGSNQLQVTGTDGNDVFGQRHDGERRGGDHQLRRREQHRRERPRGR